MEKGNKTKRRIQCITKELILKKSYSSVTMTDISQELGISIGGLYYHYHSVEEILLDIINAETSTVWDILFNNKTYENFIESIQFYFEAEKKDLLNFENTLNAILYEYYFSFSSEVRKEKWRNAFEKTYNNMVAIISPYISDSEDVSYICNHILVTLHGLNIMAMAGRITSEIIDREFRYIMEKVQQLTGK
ncbi:TetR/AcrR family transcriptional regulator [Paenibacillus dendritiformis]|uniref:TetR/AcrR family transcriptional regulator n=1 Tax=Paenibacillus dendritiformis TaxID=130049 RepID=UPI00366054CC